jgi:hypothetical protein
MPASGDKLQGIQATESRDTGTDPFKKDDTFDASNLD